MRRGASAYIDLGAVTHNLEVVRTCAPGCAVYAVVKADAYGHGAVEISRALIAAGADRLAVAFCDEAAPLREAGIRKPLMVLFDPDPDEVFQYNLIPVVNDFRTARRLSKAAVARDIKLPLHVKVDTGMGRLGIISDPEKVILDIAELRNITVEGLMSHLSESESAENDFSVRQISLLTGLRSALAEKGLDVPYCHMANSGGIINLSESRLDAVRPGLMLYGYRPGQKGQLKSEKLEVSKGKYELRPVMKLTARIIQLRKVPAGATVSYNRTFTAGRDSLIGAISIGYADGYSVAFSNNGEMLVRGRRVPVIGRVCMDITMIDLTDVDGVNEDDEVVILGNQGTEFMAATELASRINTHPYEILTSLGSRARKFYVQSAVDRPL
jgi:alanine racemase